VRYLQENGLTTRCAFARAQRAKRLQQIKRKVLLMMLRTNLKYGIEDGGFER
jgi:hypothetical protein